MFGISAFAQTPFAGLGTTAYAFSINENSSLADSEAITAAFLQSISEPVTMTDANSEAGSIFLLSLVENFNLADSNSVLAALL